MLPRQLFYQRPWLIASKLPESVHYRPFTSFQVSARNLISERNLVNVHLFLVLEQVALLKIL
jgi:hypothetical protein